MITHLLLALGVVFCLSTTTLADVLLTQPPIKGTYTVATMRNASDVASTANPMMAEETTIGQEIIFTDEGGLQMEGMGCDHWKIFASTSDVINTKDPMLADIHVPPTDSPLSSGDQRIEKNFLYTCEGESVVQVYQVDDRVLVLPWNNSSRYLIAEPLLSKKQIRTLQSQLKDMKFHHFEPTGILDTDTLEALASWAGYRLKDSEAYRFQRTAITENLLDTLRVLD